MSCRHCFMSRMQQTQMPSSINQNIPPPPQISMTCKVFVTASNEMKEMELYLDHAAFVEVYRRQVKIDDVQNALVRRTNIIGTWTTHRLAEPNLFFIACPSRNAVHQLMIGGRIEGNGFSLQVNHWDPFKDSIPYQSKLKENIAESKMTSAQDPFFIVKDEIQESIDKLHDSFHQWEETPDNSGEHLHLTKQLLANCESIKWQVDELDKAIAVAARDPAWYGLNEVELEKRRRWTNIAHNQVGSVRKAVEDGRKKSNSIKLGPSGMHRELMRLPNDRASQAGRSDTYAAEDNDDFISAESDRQLLLIKYYCFPTLLFILP
ncbi:hypothetical protein COCNU_13G006870 [Cocos nucifera]|uniref:Syntaxin 6/10/61 N-terminal domain-containing protein n=1 Tax=Cocos nucifera TaxID=13894 RepID=A0A8K0IT80_COCNU|nr:hypothetical protein COCNU_13G006870 [Cocos nucifera]